MEYAGSLFVDPRKVYYSCTFQEHHYNELADELESKGIRYRINYARGDQAAPRNGVDYSILPRTVFSTTEEIVINIY